MKSIFKKAKLCILITILLLTACWSQIQLTGLSVHVLDVDQADSILIITPNQKTVLIDAGEATHGQEVVKYLKRYGIDKIDILVGTHPHSDHIGGLPEVIRQFEIGAFYMPPKLHTTATFEKVLMAADNKGLRITTAKRGIDIALDEDISLSFLSPISDAYDNLNNWSAVIRLQYKRKVFLFTGDAEGLLEEELIKNTEADYLKANFLKVPHHGSKTSSTEGFLAAVAPEVAVISLGRGNTYGFPHKEVMERYEKRNILLYRTDQQGTIVIESDGFEIWSSQKPVNYK